MELNIYVERKRLNFKDVNDLIRADKNLSKNAFYKLDIMEKRLNNELIQHVNSYNRVIRSAFDVYEITSMSIYDEQELNKLTKKTINSILKEDPNSKELLTKVYKGVCDITKFIYNTIRRDIISQIHNIQLSKEEK